MDSKDLHQEILLTAPLFACQEPAVLDGNLVECGRPKKHHGLHATRKGTDLRLWRAYR